jgi:tetratricopeptide (TPR) repeat protein
MATYIDDPFAPIGEEQGAIYIDDPFTPMESPYSRPYAAERGSIMDIFHDLYVGTSQSLKLFGEGFGFESMEDLGSRMEQTDFFKPDITQYIGETSRIKRVISGIAQMAPTTLAIGGATAAGGLLGGPVGAGAAFGTMMGGVGKGTYDQSLEEYWQQRPDGNQFEAHQYGIINSISEVGTEAIGWLVPFGLGKMAAKSVSKNVLGALIDSGRLTANQALGAVVKNAGAKNVVGTLFGGAVADGASEVVNELIQSANRETAGLEEQPVDLIDLFLIGSAPGGVIAGGTMAMDAAARAKVTNGLRQGLASEDVNRREATKNLIGRALGNIDPELGNSFLSSVDVTEGPLDLNTIIRRAPEQTEATKIIEKPEEVLREAGIPTSPEEKPFVSNLRTEKREVATEEDPAITKARTVNEQRAAQLAAEREVQEKAERGARTIEQLRAEQRERQERLRAAEEAKRAEQEAVATGTAKIVEPTEAAPVVPREEITQLELERQYAIEQGMAEVEPDSNQVRQLKEDLRVDDETAQAIAKDPAAAAAIEETVAEIKADKEILKQPDLTLKERRSIKKAIAENEQMVEEEINDVRKAFGITEEGVAKDATGSQGVATGAAEETTAAVEAPRSPTTTQEEGPIATPSAPLNEQAEGVLRVEDGTSTKGKKFKVVDPVTGKEYRAGSMRAVKAAIASAKEGKPIELEEWDKGTGGHAARIAKEEQVVQTEEGRQEAESFNEKYLVQDEKGIKYVDDKGKALSLRNVGTDDATGYIAQAVQQLSAEGSTVSLETVKKKAQSLADRDRNKEDTNKASRAGIKGGIVSLDVFEGNAPVETQVGTPEEALMRQEEPIEGAEVETTEAAEVATEEVIEGPTASRVIRRKERVVRSEEELRSTALANLGYTEEKLNEMGTWEREEAESAIREEIEGRQALDEGDALGRASQLVRTYGGIQRAIVQLRTRMDAGQQLEPTDLEALDVLEERRAKGEALAQDFQYESAFELLQKASTSPLDKNVKQLAKYLMENEGIRKYLQTVKVVGTWEGASRYALGRVFINVTRSTTGTYVHESMHAVTNAINDGTITGPEADAFREKARGLLEKARAYALEKGYLTQEEMAYLRGTKTSSGFKEKSDWGNTSIAYGLLNEHEFFSQLFDKPAFRNFLQEIPVEKRTLLSRAYEALGSFFGWKKDSMSAFEKAMEMLHDAGNITYQWASVREAMQGPKTRSYYESLEAQDKVPNMDEVVLARVKRMGKEKSFTHKLKEQGTNIQKLAEYLARPVSDMVKARSNKLHASMMQMEARIMMKQREYTSKAKGFLNWYASLSDSQKGNVDIILANSNLSENKEAIQKVIPKEHWKNVEEILNDLHERAINVGLLVKDQKEYYFPRRIHDVLAYMDSLMKDEETKGMLGYAFMQEAKRLGVAELTDEQKAQVVTDQFQSGYFRQLPRPGATKKRTVPFVNKDNEQFYSNASDTLSAHIFEMNEKIAQREWIGGSTRKKDLADLLKSGKKIEAMKDGAEKDAAIAEWQVKADKLENLEKDLDSRLGALVAQEMADKGAVEQKELVDIISARLRQRGAHGVTDAIRNVSYITTMGNFLSAITQLGDIPILFYRYGFNKDSLDSVGTAFKNVYKLARGEITKADIEDNSFVGAADFTNALREFSQGKTSARVLDAVFKYSGLRYTDLIGKEAFMQAASKKIKRDKQYFLDKYEVMFGAETERVHKEFLDGKRTTDTMTVLIAELSDFQPVSLSQQSQAYLQGGNMRLFYILKTFTLRATSAALREGVEAAKKGNYMEAALRPAAVLGLYAFAGAGTDELKDLLRGKTSSISDNVVDNLLQMAFLSRYTVEKGIQSDSLMKTFVNNLMPPIRYADSFIADIYAIASEDKELKWRSLQSIPMIGTIAWGRSPAGQSTYASQEKSRIMELIKENKEKRKGAYSGGISDLIRDYNKNVSRDEKITNDAVQRAYKA